MDISDEKQIAKMLDRLNEAQNKARPSESRKNMGIHRHRKIRVGEARKNKSG